MSSIDEALNPHAKHIAAVAIVPARLASARLPRKMLLDLGGAPLIVRVCENLRRAGVFGRVVVACDSEEIAVVVRAAGFEAVITSQQLTSGTDRVAACAKTLDLPAATPVVNVQGDEPFLPFKLLHAVVERLRSVDGEIVTACHPYLPPPGSVETDVVKVALGADDRALYFSRANVPAVRDAQDAADTVEPVHLRHVGIYGFDAATLARIAALPPHRLEVLERLEQLRWLAHGFQVRAVLVDGAAGFGIDTAADLVRANTQYHEA